MGKKIFFVILLVLLGSGTYFGVAFYKTLRNTPERVTQTFIRDIEIGNTEGAYERLAADLKKGREQYWKDYLLQFKVGEGEATLASQEYVEDTFNAYPANSEPQRFVYTFRLQSREYVLNIVTFKIKDVWIIGELSGSYK